jgi:lysozyme family protein
MSPKFLTAINRVLVNEGGYVNDPTDPGGETKWGISKRSYPNLSISELTRDDAITIYNKDFWEPSHAEDLSEGAGYQLLDSAINSGISQSIRFMQRAIGVADDGVFGPHTLEVFRKTSETDVIMRFNAERLDFMRKLKGWPKFGSGWAGRIAQNLRYGSEDT